MTIDVIRVPGLGVYFNQSECLKCVIQIAQGFLMAMSKMLSSMSVVYAITFTSQRWLPLADLDGVSLYVQFYFHSSEVVGKTEWLNNKLAPFGISAQSEKSWIYYLLCYKPALSGADTWFPVGVGANP